MCITLVFSPGLWITHGLFKSYAQAYPARLAGLKHKTMLFECAEFAIDSIAVNVHGMCTTAVFDLFFEKNGKPRCKNQADGSGNWLDSG